MSRRSSSSRVLPASSSLSSELAAVEIAQPLPSKRDLGDPPVGVELDAHVLLVAAERVGVLELEVEVLQRPEVVRALVVLEDLVAVELVHQSSKIRRRVEQAVDQPVDLLGGGVDAEAGARGGAIPSRSISGWAQWWPARTATPWRSRISETS